MDSLKPFQRRAVRTAGIVHTAAVLPLVVLAQASQAYPTQPPMSFNNSTMTPITALELEKRGEGVECCTEINKKCTLEEQDHCTSIGSAVHVNWVVMGLASVIAMGVGIFC